MTASAKNALWKLPSKFMPLPRQFLSLKPHQNPPPFLFFHPIGSSERNQVTHFSSGLQSHDSKRFDNPHLMHSFASHSFRTYIDSRERNGSTHLGFRARVQDLRRFSTESEVDEINLKFAEAREEIDMALESKETVYFDEEAESARKIVKEVMDMYEGLLARLPEQQRGALQRSMGLKLEQLKAELKQLDDS
ncbi:uncharacterized protein LOC110007048 [Amborella trichopoda]|uniref:Uncharacterized protein n=1 Tax=Amborella trichopoda TaxID=13333 RepID=W1P7G5_AMBTC|nr:uncharacterized protein LOC110007048 [Amborella trichopoda]XP_020521414.1 uncharacterized protein LOC110007048 [Amborella trichopoda]ERN03863.1 hypothetical protein AMTR_s00078p00159930 [Amborella trichopoda]|eukprot:XP_020521413.1 uncharacterized protein LOC110007048 [Amborella trichopoda]